MKTKLTSLLLTVALLLVGCTPSAPDPTNPTKDSATSSQSTPEDQIQTDNENIPTAQPDTQDVIHSDQPAKLLTADDAVAIALEDANLTQAAVRNIGTEYEINDRVPTYEIEFRTDDTEYDYMIHAETGKILSWEQEIEHTDQMTASTSDSLARDNVLAIALHDAALTEADITNLQVEYDTEDGTYEVEFYHNTQEYSYEIQAATGKILEHEIDSDYTSHIETR